MESGCCESGRKNFGVVRLDSLAFDLTWTSGGSAVDLAGYDFVLQTRETDGGQLTASLVGGVSDGIALKTQTVSNVTTVVPGKVSVVKSVPLPAGDYDYQMVARYPLAQGESERRRRTLLEGTISVRDGFAEFPDE